MPDETFDAIVIGGGNKALFVAMYLTRYAQMKVGVFERRHEIGGCLATEESAAPGFRCNTHATLQLPWYYLPLWRDFPEFWDYGAKIDQHLCSDGAVFRKNGTCLTIYSDKYDWSQERTAAQIARFSEKDAEKYLKMRKMWIGQEAQYVQMDQFFRPVEEALDPGVIERQMAVYPQLVEAGLDPDALTLMAPHTHNVQELWDSKELQYINLRFLLGGAVDVNQAGDGGGTFGFLAMTPHIGFASGGTHQVAHAAHQVLIQDGCKFFTHADVQSVIIENGTAKGIRLSDGSEIKANKLVVSTLSPQQLCFDLIGRENLPDKIVRRAELLETAFGCLMWYSFAVHEAPKYEAAAFNPDVNECFYLGLAEDNDPMQVSRECYWSRLRKWPPIEDYCPTVWSHSLVDPSYAPPGKHILSHEQLGPPATEHTEKEWMEIKNRYLEELLGIWSKHAPNMTWDNIIGTDCQTPYDANHMKNLAPNGCMALLDRVPHQCNDKRPMPELANHRTPIANLYATGAGWHIGANSSADSSYNCYKIIAKDMNLPKPWEESGKEEPDSLYQTWLSVMEKIKNSPKVDFK